MVASDVAKIAGHGGESGSAAGAVGAVGERLPVDVHSRAQVLLAAGVEQGPCWRSIIASVSMYMFRRRD